MVSFINFHVWLRKSEKASLVRSQKLVSLAAGRLGFLFLYTVRDAKAVTSHRTS